jgi:hypothetical protein
VPTFVLISLARRRGAWLANVAGVFAVLGMTTLPGILLDFYDVAIYGELGRDAWEQVNDRLEDLPGATFLFLTAFLGFVLAPPTALLAAWRARVLSWWPAAAIAVGEIAGQTIPGGVGLLVLAASLIALTYALARMPCSRADAVGAPARVALPCDQPNTHETAPPLESAGTSEG